MTRSQQNRFDVIIVVDEVFNPKMGGSDGNFIKIQLECKQHWWDREPVYIPLEEAKAMWRRCVGCKNCQIGIEFTITESVVYGFDYSLTDRTPVFEFLNGDWRPCNGQAFLIGPEDD